MFYRMLTNPKVMALAREEADSFQEIDFRAVQEMDYIHAVMSETLRLHPPVPEELKFAAEDCTLPTGVEIKKGMGLIIPAWAKARCPWIWGDDCMEFNPSRFIGTHYNNFRFFSFNAGPRLCLGKNFAYLEVKQACARLLRMFDFELVPDQEITYVFAFTLQMKNGLKVRVKPRKECQ